MIYLQFPRQNLKNKLKKFYFSTNSIFQSVFVKSTTTKKRNKIYQLPLFSDTLITQLSSVTCRFISVAQKFAKINYWTHLQLVPTETVRVINI